MDVQDQGAEGVGFDAHGFDAEGVVHAPVVDVSDATRERLRRAVAAIICGETPEQVSGYLDVGNWPSAVTELIARPLELAELNAHVDVLLAIVQAPVDTDGA